MTLRLTGTVALSLLSLSGSAEKGPEKAAKVISQELKSLDGGVATTMYGGAIRTVPVTHVSNVIVLETDRYRTTVVEADNKQLIVPVNATVTVYQDGNHVIILDQKGKKYKFSPIHVEQLRAE